MLEVVGRAARDFLVLDTVEAAATIADVQAGNYGSAGISAGLVLCDVAKGCELLIKIPAADRRIDSLKRRVAGNDCGGALTHWSSRCATRRCSGI